MRLENVRGLATVNSAPVPRGLAPLRRVAIALLAGGLPGLVAGILWRVGMRLVALMDHHVPHFTVGATLGIMLVVGVLVGVPAGLLLLAVGRWLPRATWLRALAYGAVVLVVLGIPFIVIGPEGLNTGEYAWIKQAMFGSFFVLHGMGSALICPWLEWLLPAGQRHPRAATASYGLLGLAGVSGFILIVTAFVIQG